VREGAREGEREGASEKRDSTYKIEFFHDSSGSRLDAVVQAKEEDDLGRRNRGLLEEVGVARQHHCGGIAQLLNVCISFAPVILLVC
jgi:hypothetical protein